MGDAEGPEGKRRPGVPGLPKLPHLPEPPLGQLNLLHQADGRTVALFDPRSGTCQPKYELVESGSTRDPRIRGRWLPLRSGALALYRDGADRVVLQHGRRRVLVRDGSDVTVRSFGPVLSVNVAGKRLRMVDSRGRPGRALLRTVAGGSAGEWV